MSILRRVGNSWARKHEASALSAEAGAKRVGPALDLLLDFGRVALKALKTELEASAAHAAACRKDTQAMYAAAAKAE